MRPHRRVNHMSQIHLPIAPSTQSSRSVKAWSEPVTIPTYDPLPPDRNPMFLEKRVYQGSSGRVYPLPFYDRIAEKPVQKAWKAFHLENDLVRVMILPELGGRIHLFRDKTNGYDAIYRQDVIKPALVGLAGPWISGGIELNWPQHHRPATHMPVDTFLEHHPDGSVTLWCSDHDPLNRLKGMHGICIHPGRSVLELKVRLYNRTPFTQTFLWWANVATEVHELYQSFFPPDVSHIADHAKRATSRFPLCEGKYYGVDYASRGRHGVPESEMPSKYPPDPARCAPNDLSWYANIPVPTSYMCTGTREDFFGGYDHRARAGLVHVANHHISPGKKQWTWGNHDFGYAWDRLLVDADESGAHRPYIEIMAGVYTDNQPDFSFLAPGETKSFSQFWYPIREIGPAKAANVDAAIAWDVQGRSAKLGVAVSRPLRGATCRITINGKAVRESTHDLEPDKPLVTTLQLPAKGGQLAIELVHQSGQRILVYRPQERRETPVPDPATEPPAPADIQSADELYTTGLHLDQYRHATRMPELYWREALRRDPLDVRCNTAMGHWHLRRGEFALAETHFRRSIERQMRRNPNPQDGDALYGLGLTLRYLGRDDEAYDALYKSTWNYAQRAPAFLAIAEIDARSGRYALALDHVRQSQRTNADDLRARDLEALVLARLGDEAASKSLLASTLALDPLDWTARWLLDNSRPTDPQIQLDVAIDLMRWGDDEGALRLLSADDAALPMRPYYLATLLRRLGRAGDERIARARAAKATRDYLFPSRLEDLLVLEEAIDLNPKDARAAYALGNLLYDRRRHLEAIAQWEASARIDPGFATVHRNLGIAYFNVVGSPKKARAAYERAVDSDPQDARLVYERDQLWKRLGESPAKRLKALEARRGLIDRRDDLAVEFASLLNLVGRHEDALDLLLNRRFQPWEGGEGQALAQFATTQLALGQRDLAAGDPQSARQRFEAVLAPPESLGETRHLLANLSNVHYWLGIACRAAGDDIASKRHHTLAAEFVGDFQGMSVRAFSEMTYYSALSQRELGREREAARTFEELLKFATRLEGTQATIDYFATSLPTMLLFDDDLQARQVIAAKVMQAQALIGLGHDAKAQGLLREVLERDPSHALARDLLAALPTDRRGGRAKRERGATSERDGKRRRGAKPVRA